MSVTSGRPRSALTSALALFVLACLIEPALAQAKNPFSVGISEGGGTGTGLTGWLLVQQGWFERLLSTGVRAARLDGSAVWSLAGVGFVYGIFHAAGPGHGKAVLASYMVANERALRRGIALSFLAALLQGLVAIALVSILALLLNATALRMKDAASLVETLSFLGIACLGAWLVWRKGWALAAAWRASRADRPSGAGAGFSAFTPAAFAVAGASKLSFATAAAPAQSRFVCVDGDAVAHVPGCACHGLDPSTLGGVRFSWREALLTVVAAGSRPCSGAILVLVFALAQGVYWAGLSAVLAMSLGVAITTAGLASIAVLAKGLARRLARPGSRWAALATAGLEFGAALLVLLAGLSLTAGMTLIGSA